MTFFIFCFVFYIFIVLRMYIKTTELTCNLKIHVMMQLIQENLQEEDIHYVSCDSVV